MALLLLLETATEVCSVALAENEQIIALKETSSGNSHSANLTTFIEDALKQSGKTLQQLDAVAVSMGPGSYTGLRIGVSSAKGLCYGLGIPLISVGTLQAMALGATFNKEEEILYCPMIDARRMEVYAAIYDKNNSVIKEVSADIIDENSYQEYLNNNKILFFGNGAAKCKEVLSKHTNALFLEDAFASASKMHAIATAKYDNKQFEDIAYFEPFYLKDFIAAKPVVKGLY